MIARSDDLLSCPKCNMCSCHNESCQTYNEGVCQCSVATVHKFWQDQQEGMKRYDSSLIMFDQANHMHDMIDDRKIR